VDGIGANQRRFERPIDARSPAKFIIMSLQLDTNPETPNPNPNPSTSAVAAAPGATAPAATGAAAPPFAAAYAAMLDAIRAVPPDETLHINVDVPGAIMSTLGRLPRLLALRGELVAKLPTWDARALDTLDDCARAAGHAYSLHVAASTPPGALAELAAAATEARAALLSDASALAHHGFVDRRPLGELKGPIGYKNLAFDLLVLDHVLRAAWPHIEGKTAVTLERLDAAAILADRLLVAAGIKTVSTREIAEAARIRDQAFTLFMQTYDSVRRAVVYARWDEGDADEIAPSLYAGRARRQRPDPDPDETLDPVIPPTVTATGGAVAPTPPAAAPAAPAAGTPGKPGVADAGPFTP